MVDALEWRKKDPDSCQDSEGTEDEYRAFVNSIRCEILDCIAQMVVEPRTKTEFLHALRGLRTDLFLNQIVGYDQRPIP